MKGEIKYNGHRENEDGSCNVSFRRPDGLKYYVHMPSKWKSVLDWIKDEGIEIFLSKKFESDKSYDESNNIQRRLRLRVSGIIFHFDSFDGHIEIYNASFGYHESSGLLDSLTSMFDLTSTKFTNLFIEKAKDNNIEIKTIKVVKQRWDKDFENVEINGTWEEFNRDRKLNQLEILS